MNTEISSSAVTFTFDFLGHGHQCLCAVFNAKRVLKAKHVLR